MLVPPDAEEYGLELVFVDDLFQGIRFELGAAFELHACGWAHAFRKLLLVSSDDEGEVPLTGEPVPELVHVGELVARVDVDNGEGDPPEECLPYEPEKRG